MVAAFKLSEPELQYLIMLDIELWICPACITLKSSFGLFNSPATIATAAAITQSSTSSFLLRTDIVHQ